MAFVQNDGQWENPARFVARRGAMTAFFEPGSIRVGMQAVQPDESVRGATVRLSFEGARTDACIEGEDRQQGRHSFFRGERSQWRAGVASYTSVLYRGLYDGIDLRVRDNGNLAGVRPAAGPRRGSRVVSSCAAPASTPWRSPRTDHWSCTPPSARSFREAPLTWYEQPDGTRRPVECTYCLIDETRYGFEVPAPNGDERLVIDPALEWSTFLGGSGRRTGPLRSRWTTPALVTMAGTTYSTDFPVTDGAFDIEADQASWDGFVSRLSADGSTLLWSTYLGGHNGGDYIFAMHVDEAGLITVAGRTYASDFPTTTGAYDETFGGGPPGSSDAFIAQLDPSQENPEDQLVWSTFLGGGGHGLGGGPGYAGRGRHGRWHHRLR